MLKRSKAELHLKAAHHRDIALIRSLSTGVSKTWQTKQRHDALATAGMDFSQIVDFHGIGVWEIDIQ